VRAGGGACATLDNLQTLCVPCHVEKTAEDAKAARAAAPAAAARARAR